MIDERLVSCQAFEVSSLYDLHLSKIRVALPSGKTLFSIPELAIPFGSHILIQGESGKGKTTLLHLMAGLFSPDQGSVLVGEHRLDQLSEDDVCELRRSKIGVIFQKLNLVDHLTVEENVFLPLQGDDLTTRAHKALEHVNLRKPYTDRCSVLSLGEQQRVAVARVIASEPQIILADEPTSSLDQKNRGLVMDALKKAANGRTLIVVSHDHRISEYFDRVLQFEEIIQKEQAP